MSNKIVGVQVLQKSSKCVENVEETRSKRNYNLLKFVLFHIEIILVCQKEIKNVESRRNWEEIIIILTVPTKIVGGQL